MSSIYSVATANSSKYQTQAQSSPHEKFLNDLGLTSQDLPSRAELPSLHDYVNWLVSKAGASSQNSHKPLDLAELVAWAVDHGKFPLLRKIEETHGLFVKLPPHATDKALEQMATLAENDVPFSIEMHSPSAPACSALADVLADSRYSVRDIDLKLGPDLSDPQAREHVLGGVLKNRTLETISASLDEDPGHETDMLFAVGISDAPVKELAITMRPPDADCRLSAAEQLRTIHERKNLSSLHLGADMSTLASCVHQLTKGISDGAAVPEELVLRDISPGQPGDDLDSAAALSRELETLLSTEGAKLVSVEVPEKLLVHHDVLAKYVLNRELNPMLNRFCYTDGPGPSSSEAQAVNEHISNWLSQRKFEEAALGAQYVRAAVVGEMKRASSGPDFVPYAALGVAKAVLTAQGGLLEQDDQQIASLVAGFLEDGHVQDAIRYSLVNKTALATAVAPKVVQLLNAGFSVDVVAHAMKEVGFALSNEDWSRLKQSGIHQGAPIDWLDAMPRIPN